MNDRNLLLQSTARLVPLAALLLAFTTGARECDDGGVPPGACEVDGVVYDDGATGVPAPDGCNTCTCSAGELTYCTEIACPPPGGACVVDGVAYPDGASGIPAPDGCNTCACAGGALACTERACPPMGGSCVIGGVEYPDGATDVPAPDGCNSCTCDDGVVTSCTELACAAPPGSCSVFGVAYSQGWAPDPDGCNTCTCEEGQVTGSCTDRACGLPAIEACTAWSAPFVSDGFELTDVRVDGDTLHADVGYSGGCQPHYFRLCYDPAFRESYPVQVSLRLEHDAQMDPCEAYASETRSFDLSPLAAAYASGYGTEHDRVFLYLGDGSVEYSF